MSQHYDPAKKALGKDKLSRIPIKIEMTSEPLRKPDWIRIKLPINNKVSSLKNLLRENRMVTVCEEASCPNLHECFGNGIATFMIMGDKCTRRCSFCDVGHGRPDPLDPEEPSNLAKTVKTMQLKFVVITSVDRDDLRDGGALHYTECINAIRDENPNIQIEVLVPDFRGRMEKALDILAKGLPDVFNHNVETIPRLYKIARPGADFLWSLSLLKTFKERFPGIPTKSGIMVGLGETKEEIIEVMQAMREHDIDILTIGQYLQPTRYHMPVARYVTPDEFNDYARIAKEMEFDNVASGPLVRSSYHADKMAAGEVVS